MSMTINTNVSSLNAQRNLSGSQGALATSLQRLSSGMRINSAKDDAAGLAISERMTSQIRGMDQARRNANDGISLAQTAEGAMTEIGNNLQRMRELAVQAANDTNSASDRESLQKEVTALSAEIERIANTTEFNGKKIIDGSLTNAQFQVGANANQTISFAVGSSRASEMGGHLADSKANVGTALAAAAATTGGNGVAGQTLTVSGSLGSKDVVIGPGASAKDIASAVNGAAGSTGVKATARTTTTLASLGDAGTVEFKLKGKSEVSIKSTVANKDDLSGLASEINKQVATTGITAKLSDDKKSLELVNDEGYNIEIADFKTSATGTATVSVGGQALSGAAASTTDSIVVGGKVSFSGTGAYSVTSTDSTNNTLMAAGSTASALSSVANQKVTNFDDATKAIAVLDGAIQYIGEQRAGLGAIQNRFSSTISNLQSSAENLNASRGRILDADFAAETAKMSRNQVLQQAGTAMLAQANQLPQQVLQLLR